VLCLDDLHWVDEATLAWLSYFGREMASDPVLVLGTCRSGEAEKISALRSELRRQAILHEVHLEGLTQGDVLNLVRGLSGRAVAGRRFGEHLHRETGGNPFFLLETLRAMFEAGLLRQDEGGWTTALEGSRLDDRRLPIPDTVQQAIRDRLRRLPPQTCQVLEAAAVIGHRFDLDLVQQTGGRQESEVVDSLDRLVARQLISEQEGRYHFNHDLIRAVVLGDLSYGRRRLLHRRAGEALEALRPDDVEALAWHFACAEESAKAAHYALQAGIAARNVFAHVEARAQFDRALTALTREATRLQDPQALAANRRLRIQALDGRGWAFRLLGDMEAYARDSQEVARLAALLGDQATLAHLRWREAYAHRWFCRYEQARQAATEGVRLSQAAGDLGLEARCWREVGMAARETGYYQEAQEALERALSLFVNLDQPVYEIHTLGNLSTLCGYRGDHQRAMELARRALARCEEASLPLERRLPLGDMGAAAAATGDFDFSCECLTDSLAIARQIADRTQEILCLGHLGWLYVQRDQPTESLEHLQAGLALAEGVGSCTEQSWLLSGLAEAWRLAGDRDQAEDCARRALALARRTGRVRDERIARRLLQSLS
jgi:tetratricopeptide (TPR) repeat protein